MPLLFEALSASSPGAECTSEGLLLKDVTLVMVDQIKAALQTHGVLVFRGQQALNPHDELALARCFDHDPSEEHPSASSRLFGPKGEPWLEECPAVRLVGHVPGGVRDYFGTAADVKNYSNWAEDQRAWHQDGTADTAPGPPRVGLLRSVRCPSRGGDTLFACTRRIAAQLLREEAEGGPASTLDPPPSKSRALYRRPLEYRLSVDGVAIEQASGHLTESHGPYPLIACDDAGPFVIYNWNLEAVLRPDDSRLGPEASWGYGRALMGESLNDEKQVYRHEWREGDLVLWDNWATVHSATASCLYEGEDRLLHRVRLCTIRPPRPFFDTQELKAGSKPLPSPAMRT